MTKKDRALMKLIYKRLHRSDEEDKEAFDKIFYPSLTIREMVGAVFEEGKKGKLKKR